MQISINCNRQAVTQMLKTMKLFALILFVACLQVSAKSDAQTVSLNFQDVSIEKVLKEIKKQTGYLFLYKAEDLKNTGLISVRVSHADISDAVSMSLNTTALTFKIVDKTIILKRKPADILTGATMENAQNIIVHGRVVDANSSPLSGASIRVSGSKIGTSTDANGDFVLNNVNEDATLVASFVGYTSQTFKVDNRTEINITLQLAVNNLDETVVIGYGKTSKRLNTGSVSSVTSAILEKQPVSDPLGALQGRVSGLMITSSNGNAGSSFQVRIRGENSIKQGNDPLYIIDGVPFISSPLNQFDGANGNQSPLNTINPNDIERIDVLKDADATAIYGSRAANGVVLITTKKGKSGINNVSVNMYTGVSKVAHKMKMLNTAQYLQLRKDAFKFDSVAATPNNAPDLLTWDQNANTDWQDLLIGNTGRVSAAQVSFSGGNSQTSFLFSTNYRRETSVLIGSPAYQKGGGLLSINHHSKNYKFGITASANFSIDDNNSVPTDVTQYINLPPNYPKYNPDGSLYWFGNLQNPLALLKRTYNTKTNNLIGNTSLHYTIIKGLDIKANFGYTQTTLAQVQTLPEAGFNPVNYTGSYSQFGNSSVRSYIAEPQVTYTTTAGNGTLNLLAGGSWQQSISDGEYLLASGYSSDALLKDLSSATSVTVRNSNYAQYNYQSFFGRVNYDLYHKYLLNATFRRDGSSRFGPGHQFGNFGAVGAGWIFTEEKFISNAIPFLSFGKLRASYGSTGNDQIGDYQYLDSWSSAGFPYGGISGLAPSRVYNANYSWEVNKKLELALELGFLKDRILLTTGYYNNRSSNQLVGYSLSPQAGFSDYTANLPAKVENKGLEFDLNTINVKSKDFQWTTSFNLSIPKNKLLAYPDLANSADATSYEVGQSIRLIKGFQYTGVDPNTGLPTFADQDKDGYISDPEDYVVMGQTMPTYFGGMSNDFTYKKLSLSIFFQFVKQDAPTIDYGPLTSTFGALANKGTYVLDYWKAPGDVTSIPRPTTTSNNPAYQAFVNNYVYSSAAFGDASYIRLKNVSLSYDLSSLTEKWKIANSSIYVQGENLFTITNYRGLDPEINGFDRRFVYPINPFGSVRPQALPVLRTITVGLKFTL